MAGAPAGRRVVLGLDVGTTAAKASAFALGGAWRTGAGREYPLRQPQPGWEVQDPDVIWRAVRDALADVATDLADAGVVGIGVSTAMHGLIALDAQRRPITPLLTWADSRAAVQAMRLRDTELGRRLHRTSGTPVHSMSPLCKLLWYAENDPGLVSAARSWVNLKDYILLQLTGELVTEVSSASGTGLLDLRTRDWNPEALALVGVTREQLPPVLPTTDVLRLRDDLAGMVGLPPGVPVVLGAGDGPLGNLGVGALEPGVVGLSLGTSGAVRMITAQPYVDDAGTLFCYHLADDAWLIGGAISNGGIVVRWAGDVFGATTGDGGAAGAGGGGGAAGAGGATDAGGGAGGNGAADAGGADHGLLELAREVPIGADGLVMLPFLLAERAPLWNPTIPGAFLGVRRSHTRAHFVRAAVEGVALMLSVIVDELDRVTPIRQIRATGGVFRSTVWRDVLAAALGKPLVVTDGAQGTSLGAAALALYGLGVATSLREALTVLGQNPDSASGQIVPDPADVAAYRAARAGIPALLASYDEVRTLFS